MTVGHGACAGMYRWYQEFVYNAGGRQYGTGYGASFEHKAHKFLAAYALVAGRCITILNYWVDLIFLCHFIRPRGWPCLTDPSGSSFHIIAVR